jgi:hypothetical protein
MRKALAILAACGVLLTTLPNAGAEPAPSNWPGRPGRYLFEITRDGKPIGTQTVEVQQNGETVIATTESTIAVKMLGIVVYRMHQVLTETYQGRRLVALKAETKDPDGLRAGEIARDGDHWSGKLGKQHRDFDCDCIASTMWQMAGLKGPSMIEASQVRLRSVTVEDKGRETLDLPEGRVVTRHLSVKGDIEREVWYDPNGNLVAAEQIGSDGSLIRQKLLSDPSGRRAAGQEAGEP